MRLFEIHTEENEKEVDFGIHGVYSDNKKDAIKYAETEFDQSKIDAFHKGSIPIAWMPLPKPYKAESEE